MKLSKLRWSVQSLAFVVLLFGGTAGIFLGFFLPTLSCPYVGYMRGGDCFLLNLQFHLALGGWNVYAGIIKNFLIFSLLVVLAGRFWCGWICPFGFIQDILNTLRVTLDVKSIAFYETVKKNFLPIKWFFLGLSITVPVWIAYPLCAPCMLYDLSMPFCQLCPARYILPLAAGNPEKVSLNFKSAATVVMTSLGLLIASAALVGSFLKKRFWCFLCPMGLLLSLYQKISFMRLKKDCAKCTMCEACYLACPMNIGEVFRERKNADVTYGDCIFCGKCIDACPENDALGFSFLGKTFFRSSADAFFRNHYRIDPGRPAARKKE